MRSSFAFGSRATEGDADEVSLRAPEAPPRSRVHRSCTGFFEFLIFGV